MGLYLAPPENAVVLCVDEKSQIHGAINEFVIHGNIAITVDIRLGFLIGRTVFLKCRHNKVGKFGNCEFREHRNFSTS